MSVGKAITPSLLILDRNKFVEYENLPPLLTREKSGKNNKFEYSINRKLKYLIRLITFAYYYLDLN